MTKETGATETGDIRITLADDGGLEIVIDRPDAGNALTAAMTDALADAIAAPPDGAKFIVLQGAGADFCAGRVSPMPKDAGPKTPEQIRSRVADPVLDFYDTVRRTPLPVIAAVRGRAHGVGCALAGLADIVLADDSADFRIPEMARDIPPLLVGAALAGRLPRAALARLIYGRESIDAATALQMGLACEICTAAGMEASLQTWRARLADNSPTVLATVKRFLNLVPETGFAGLREYAAVANSAAVSERFIVPKG
ncbi:enoyl-CoA hydratase/isomerase family protein [Puniceibacterium sp. IMCC21224]|uniref:enoyl-CoA hydratase/isomerase family protein n=1 Tax=Puniceibacterium sp. IMCC21224 TaxID=1618204 RepID=UPI00065D1A29|nr:enoyl-CoA hydratase/isomerase family protein [Puniceibacterium sp. IMCC21224]KMK68489.1 enoyl-CoA hydratase/carnithine racemase [Puniceibacterium sp. IMCC21224]